MKEVRGKCCYEVPELRRVAIARAHAGDPLLSSGLQGYGNDLSGGWSGGMGGDVAGYGGDLSGGWETVVCGGIGGYGGDDLSGGWDGGD